MIVDARVVEMRHAGVNINLFVAFSPFHDDSHHKLEIKIRRMNLESFIIRLDRSARIGDSLTPPWAFANVSKVVSLSLNPLSA